ncbi:MAG TPA: TIGR04255 family protein [Nitrospirales bacterium]|nr:TIGR04255 family protein [Nitrospirales bacterium]
MNTGMHPYEGWDAFQTHIRLATNAVEKKYPPPYLSRIWLHFRNIIRRSALGLTDKDWNQLLQNKWTGDLAWPEMAGAMKATHSEVVMGLNGGDDLVCVRHKIVPIAQPIQEMGYLIDHDFFVNGQFSMTEISRKLTEYHQAAQRFFKLWITDMLHQAMKPAT